MRTTATLGDVAIAVILTVFVAVAGTYIYVQSAMYNSTGLGPSSARTALVAKSLVTALAAAILFAVVIFFVVRFGRELIKVLRG